jgi:hypothetical protein
LTFALTLLEEFDDSVFINHWVVFYALIIWSILAVGSLGEPKGDGRVDDLLLAIRGIGSRLKQFELMEVRP